MFHQLMTGIVLSIIIGIIAKIGLMVTKRLRDAGRLPEGW